jgi:hypothetical protein
MKKRKTTKKEKEKNPKEFCYGDQHQCPKRFKERDGKR